MNKEHERKIKNDNDKFDALLDQKEQTMKDWQEKILQLKMNQKEQIDQIIKDHEAEKRDLETEMADLEHKQKAMEEHIPK